LAGLAAEVFDFGLDFEVAISDLLCGAIIPPRRRRGASGLAGLFEIIGWQTCRD
jgi:hypothetical protein